MMRIADIVQLVERHFAKVEVAGSSPAVRSKSKYKTGRWLNWHSSGFQIRHLLGSSPSRPAKYTNAQFPGFCHRESSLGMTLRRTITNTWAIGQ